MPVSFEVGDRDEILALMEKYKPHPRHEPMQYYCQDKGSGRLVYPDDPIDADADEILEVWDDMTDAAGSFFGVVLARGEVLQFRWEESGRILIDIPKPSLGGSLQLTFRTSGLG